MSDLERPHRARWLRLIAIAVLATIACSCHRETRALTPSAADARRPIPIRDSNLQPGARKLIAATGNSPAEGNAYAISQGQQLFEQYNCAGCHFHGGGGIGPALMDDEWTYGNTPANVYESISEGRPNGMPSFGGHIPDYQIWELVAYVRSLGGLEPRNASGVRSEEMEPKRAEEPK